MWSSVVENVNIRTAYPFSACVGLSVSTEEFQSLPTRAYLVRGRKVRVPSNAVPREDGSLEFVGNFDGSLGEAVWTTCPVCIFYDLLINQRYGAGDFIQANNLSWVDLYPLAQYANHLVNGEPRFACNVQVASQVEAFTALQDFASVFRGMMYWQSNVIQLTADHGNLDGSNIDPVHIFSNSNVVQGVFDYSGSSLKTRSTSVRVRYSDPDSFYKPNVVVTEDAELISKYGYQVKDVLAFGCTSRKQAKRLGRWILKSEELDANTVTFAVGLDGALVFPGQVFAIQDELRAGARLSGRISSATTTTIVADQSITLPGGSNPVLTCVLSDGTVESQPIDVDNTIGTTIAVTTAFSDTPLVQAVYSIATDNVSQQKFRCLSVADNGDGTFAVVGVEFNDSIYAAADAQGEVEFEDLFREQPEFLYGIFGAMLIANVLFFIFGFFGAKIFARITLVPNKILWPMIFAVSVCGTYSLSQSILDVWIMIFFGVIGFFMRRYGFSVVPVIIGLILGELVEGTLRLFRI